MVGLSNSSTSAGPSTRSSSQSGGHQLFAFNSEHQPWMSRLGFPRIRVEVTDPPSTDEGDMEEEMRRAIRESLGLNLSSSSLSSHSIGSSPAMSPSPGRSGASTPLGPFTPMYAASSSALATGLHGQSDSMFLRRGSACSASASNFDYERAKEV
ncbi:hypothetical protein BGW42_004389 [Actinomortierella wolfii]|nr:hypothetical protein BGW42_004389 [Actinomortierella wolfii]